jgi:L-malate glycosyltransferase
VTDLRKVRVVHILGTTGGGGAERQALYLLQSLRESLPGLELTYFRRGPDHERFEALGIPLHPIDQTARLAIDLLPRALRWRQCLATRPPDLVHSWLFEAHLIALLGTVGWPTRLVLAHRSSFGAPRDRRHMAALRPLRRRVDFVIANSPAGAEMMAEFGIPLSRLAVIPNAVPSERLDVHEPREAIRKRLGFADNTVICAVGRPDPAKDFPNLLAAFERVHAFDEGTRLLIVGSSRAQLRALGVVPCHATITLGYQDRVIDYMNAADVVVVPSRTEGHSNVADEALLLGKPVVTTDVGGHVRVVRDAKGAVVPTGRSDLLGDAIIRMMRDPPMPKDVATAASAMLSTTRLADCTLAVYMQALAANRGHRD